MRVVLLAASLGAIERPRTYGLDVSEIAEGGRKWGGAVTVGTTVYAVPLSAGSILEVNTTTGRMRGITVPDAEGTEQWHGAAVVDGAVYGMPFNAAAILCFDTAAQLVSTVDVSILADGATTWKKWGVRVVAAAAPPVPELPGAGGRRVPRGNLRAT